MRALLHSTYALAKLKETDRAPPEGTELMTVTAEGDVQGHPQECAANQKQRGMMDANRTTTEVSRHLKKHTDEESQGCPFPEKEGPKKILM